LREIQDRWTALHVKGISAKRRAALTIEIHQRSLALAALTGEVMVDVLRTGH
jgi:hypothetical protein